MTIEPTPDALARFAEEAETPFVMLNLLRFADGGRESYLAYGHAMHEILPRYGGSFVYAGDAESPLVPGTDDWDAVLLVRYPSRERFLAMIADPEYQEATKLRTAALSSTVLQPTIPW